MTEQPRIQVRRYVAGDAALVEVRPEQAMEIAGRDPERLKAPDGPAWTLTRNGFVIGCAGVRPEGDGRASAWALVGCAPPDVRRAIARECREALRQLSPLYRRIEAHARVDFPEGQRFLEWLGFRREGIARRYGVDGADYVTFARVS